MRHTGIAMGLLISASAIAAPVPHHTTAKLATKQLAPKPAPPLPVFSFMGEDTETATTRTSINGSACHTEGAVLDCTDYNDPKLAGTSAKFLYMKFNSGKLYDVFASFGPYAYPKLLSAFAEKYGNPVITTEKWQSKGGATFDNAVATWKFKGGTLELDQMGLDTSSGSFQFRSEANAPAPDKPKVDF